MKIPKVFISYSHDSEAHKEWVEKLASRLKAFHINVIIDSDLPPGGNIQHFMDSHLEDADRILVICTERSVAKMKAGKGGVAYEKNIIADEVMEDTNKIKVIPIVRHKGNPKVPSYLRSKRYLDFSEDHHFESNLEELVHGIKEGPDHTDDINTKTNQFSSSTTEDYRDFDLAGFMTIMNRVRNNTGHPWTKEQEIKEYTGLSNIELKKLIKEAVGIGYVEISHTGKLHFTKEGKTFLGIP
ncbi:MAG: toll/interleukin-1 receptor domain-containing protein [Cytophagales bacterium]|nr:toll/interleukin-1 receptor domain-containing protein [Cytophagales bacterium]